MVKIDAKVNGEQVDVHSEAEGKTSDVMEESMAIIEALYRNIAKVDPQLKIVFLSVLGESITEWMEEATDGMIGELTGGDLYA